VPFSALNSRPAKQVSLPMRSINFDKRYNATNAINAINAINATNAINAINVFYYENRKI